MSQNDFNIANQGFPSFRSDLNDALQALASNSSGATEPATTYAGQFWYDSTNDVLKFRNEANSAWISPPIAGLVQALSDLGVTASAAELNKLDGVLTTTAELNYVDGVTSNIQTQLNGKVDTSGDSMTGNLSFGYNDKAVFGVGGSALEVFHDGSNKYITDAGSGSLFIRGSDLVLEDASGNDYITMSDTGTGGTVTLKHNASTKLATTSTGINVTGTVAATSYTGDGSALTGVGGSTTYGAVGTYLFGRRAGSYSSQAAFNAGSTYSGSTLYPAGLSSRESNTDPIWDYSSHVYIGNASSAALSGTWRAMGTTTNVASNLKGPVTLFVRIS